MEISLNQRLVDFHCHLDLFPNFQGLINLCEQNQIYTLGVTTSPRAWARNKELTQNCNFVRPALGLHPELIGQFYHELDLLISLIPECKYIGEVGLDGSSQHKETFSKQENAFRVILTAATKNGGRIFSIHSRNAATNVLNCLEQNSMAGKFVLHWFTGSQTELLRAISIGCLFSVGPAMVNTKKGSEIIKLIPKHQLLTETDAPFAKVNGSSLKPSDVSLAIEGIAAIWKVSLTDCKAQIVSNLKELMQLAN